MIALKKGQGAALTVVPEPPKRTPERQALADAIEAREYVATLVKERRELAEQINRNSYPHYDKLKELEERERDLPRDERDRLNLLLSRRDPDARTEREKIAAERAEIDEKLKVIKAEHRRAEADVQLLEEDHQFRASTVRDRVVDVVLSDPALPAVVAETERLLKRLAVLRRACGSAFNERHIGQPAPAHARYASLIVPPEGPCPWNAVKARLVNDPDAVFPMPGDI